MPHVAIITRTRNRPLLLPRAARSVLGQSFGDWVHVIVNDAGDPRVVEEALAPFHDSYGQRLRVVHRSSSSGMEAASNEGLRASDSDLVVIHDDDDAWDPRFLAEGIAYLRRHQSVPTLGGVVTHITRIEERIDGDRVVEVRRRILNRWLKRITLIDAVGTFAWVPIAFLFKREALLKVGYFREDYPVFGDHEFNLRFIRQWDIGVIPEPLAFYHVRIPDTSAADYRNSINAQEELFALHSSRLRNELLRQDLDSGRFGMGTLINLSTVLGTVSHNTHAFGKVADLLLANRFVIGSLRLLKVIKH